MEKIVEETKEVVKREWYAVYTKPRWEKKVDALLKKKEIDSWCPTQKVQKQWSDRKKVIEEPLFRSYVFVHINFAKQRLDSLMTDGVLNFVYYLGKPAIIKDEEVLNIKKYLAFEDARVEIISKEGFKADTKVKINFGVFMDKEGVVLRGNKKKVYVQITSLGTVMVVEFPANYLIPM
jgi:transcription antitermination factor NusG